MRQSKSMAFRQVMIWFSKNEKSLGSLSSPGVPVSRATQPASMLKKSIRSKWDAALVIALALFIVQLSDRSAVSGDQKLSG
jgi:hypothetical protein